MSAPFFLYLKHVMPGAEAPGMTERKEKMRDYAVIPNKLILDSRLRPSARRARRHVVCVSWPWQRALQVHEGPDKALPLLPENPAPGIGATRRTPLPETPSSVPLVTAAETAYLQGKPLLSPCRSVAGIYVGAPQHPSHRRHSHTVFHLPAPHGPSGSEQPQLSVSPADFCNLVDCKIYRLSGRCCAGTRAVYRQEPLSQPEGLLFVQLLLPHSDPGGRANLGITGYSIPCSAEIDKSWRWSDF